MRFSKLLATCKKYCEGGGDGCVLSITGDFILSIVLTINSACFNSFATSRLKLFIDCMSNNREFINVVDLSVSASASSFTFNIFAADLC